MQGRGPAQEVSRRNLVVGGVVLAGAGGLLVVAMLAAQPEAVASDCCPCEREAAYLADLQGAAAAWSMNRVNRRFGNFEGSTLGGEHSRAEDALLDCIREHAPLEDVP